MPEQGLDLIEDELEEAEQRSFLPTLPGNIVGGAALVAALNHAQVFAGKADSVRGY